MLDMVIKNGMILDGTGKDSYVADVGIKDGKIAEIGQDLEGRETLDANGLVVSPGWIDAHSHSDLRILEWRDQKEKVEQGITFSIGGQCGGSVAPKADMSMAQVFEKLNEEPVGSGLAVMVGHGTIRRRVLGTENIDPTPEQLEKMKDILRQSLEAGARGMTLGLYYIPGCYAKKDELVAMAKVVAEYDGVLAAHLRNESDTLVEAVEEFLSVVKEAGCRAVVSHHKAAMEENWGKINTTIAMIDQVNAQGGDVHMDVYPYCASKTSLRARFIPVKYHPPGTTDVKLLLDVPEIKQQLTDWIVGTWQHDLSSVLLTGCVSHPEYLGLNMNEIAKLRGQYPHEAVFDLIRNDPGSPGACFFSMREEDVKTVMAHPRTMICTDSGVAGDSTSCHPRLRGSFPRTLGKYVREEGVTSLPEMIRKMTSLPAKVYKLEGKGMVAEGYDADLCIFDPDVVADQAEYVDWNKPNLGLNWVIIDGKVVAENGVHNGVRAAKLM